MLLRQMKYFAAIMDFNSFTEAAEQCYISQSAISQQIQSLEKELGVKLIQRENRKFSLTPAGKYFTVIAKMYWMKWRKSAGRPSELDGTTNPVLGLGS